MMDIDFGVGIRDFLFEQDVSESRQAIRQRIGDQVLKYMPFVSIQAIRFPVVDGSGHMIDISYVHHLGTYKALQSRATTPTIRAYTCRATAPM